MRHSRNLALALAALLAVAAPALASSTPRRYAGTTSQGTAVQLRVLPDRRRVTMTIYYRVRCNDGGAPQLTYTRVGAMSLRRGHFSAAGVYKGSVDGSTNDYRLAGSLSAGHASGRFSLHATVRRHGRTVRCSSGRLAWRAE